MAYDGTPTEWIASWSEDGTDVTFPIASVPELTATEADGSTGDIRNILFALCELFASDWYALDSADRPTNMTISKSSYTDNATGVTQNTYQFRFNCNVTGQEVVAES